MAYLAVEVLAHWRQPHQQRLWQRPAHEQHLIHLRMYIGSLFGIGAFDNCGIICEGNGIIVSDGNYQQSFILRLYMKAFKLSPLDIIRRGKK